MPRAFDNADRPTKRGDRRRSDNMKRSKKQQKRVDRTLGARAVPGSGAPSECGGDSDYIDILQENKVTKHRGLYVKGDWLAKITEEAMTRGREPAFCFTIEELTGERTPSGYHVSDTWVALPLAIYKRRVVENEPDELR